MSHDKRKISLPSSINSYNTVNSSYGARVSDFLPINI